MDRPTPAARAALGLIGFYRKGISPFLAPACRFEPSCSAYAEEAVRRHGFRRGGWLAVRRLLRCHPLGGEGHDPVPPGRAPEPDHSAGRKGRER